MEINKLNDAPIVDQMDGQWARIAMLLVFKLGGGKPVKITHIDMIELAEKQMNGGAILFTHGMADGIEYSIVNNEEAQMIAAHQAATTSKGSH